MVPVNGAGEMDDGGGLGRRGFLRGSALAGATALTSLPVEAASPELTAGAARRDITPENCGEFFGYVRPDMRAEGVSTDCSPTHWC